MQVTTFAMTVNRLWPSGPMKWWLPRHLGGLPYTSPYENSECSLKSN